jgi:hypothetical protein
MIYKLIESVCSTLDRVKIPYMLTGSGAMDFHTVGRSTKDLDIVIELKESEVEVFLAEFNNHYHHRPSIIEEIRRKGMFNIIDFESGFKIDFILRKETPYALIAFSRRKSYPEALGLPIWVIAVEDLVIAKLMWIQQLYSDRQMNDIQQLMQNPNIDYSYLKHWLTDLKLNTFDLKI